MIGIDLRGKTAVVTGGSGELGREIAKVLAECGADVAVHYYHGENRALAVVDSIKAIGSKAMCVKADVSKLAEVAAMGEAVATALGNPDIIVNAAVVQYKWTTVLEQPVEDYISQFESCVLHNVNMAKVFVPHMITKRWGRVIGINTECAMQNFPTQSAYTAGKRGMDGVLRVLAKEVGEHQITVNQVAPGWTISDRERTEGIEEGAGYINNVPLKRRGTDREVANVVAFLASGLADNITGAYIPVCGGNVMPAI